MVEEQNAMEIDSEGMSSPCVDTAPPLIETRHSLANLPTEVLINILSSIDPYYGDRVLGYNPYAPGVFPVDPYLFYDFQRASKAFLALSISCMRISPLAQEFLLRGPIIHGFIYNASRGEFDLSPALRLARTLLEKPSLGKHIKQFRIYLPDTKTIVKESETCSASPSSVGLQPILDRAKQLITSLDLPDDIAQAWAARLDTHLAYAITGIILVLCPNIQKICLSHRIPASNQRIFIHESINTLFGILPSPKKPQEPLILPFLQHIPAISSLTYLKIMSPHPLNLTGLSSFPNLRTLDLSSRCTATLQIPHDPYLAADVTSHTRGISHLRLDFQDKRMGRWPGSLLKGFGYVVCAFTQLSSLEIYGEPSRTKEPDWRQHMVQPGVSEVHGDPDAWGMFGDEPGIMKEDNGTLGLRIGGAEFPSLVAKMAHLEERLTCLCLPGGAFTRAYKNRRGVPVFKGFRCLKTLVAPQEAFVSIKLEMQVVMVGRDGPTSRSAEEGLPGSLERLRVFDAGEGIFGEGWLEELFECQKRDHMWPGLGRVEVACGMEIGDERLEELRGRRCYWGLWGLVDELEESMGLKFVVERDDGVPEVGAW